MGLPEPRIAVTHHRGHALVLSDPSTPQIPPTWPLSDVGSRPRSSRPPSTFFCGAGGLSLGLQDAGFSVLVGADSDPACVETHVANLRGLGFIGDLTDPAELLSHLSAWGIGTVDLGGRGRPLPAFLPRGTGEATKPGHAGLPVAG